MKRLLTLLCVLVLTVSLCACAGEPLAIKTVYNDVPSEKNKGGQLTGSEFVKVAENSNFSLNVNPENGQFYVENLADGYIYSSCPLGIDEDAISNAL